MLDTGGSDQYFYGPGSDSKKAASLSGSMTKMENGSVQSVLFLQ